MTINASVAFLIEAAVYFEKRPTGGEDLAHWSNVLNAENCTKTADLITAQSLRIEELEKALKPFADFADALSDEVPDNISIGIFAGGAMRFGPSGGANLASLRAARSALSGEQG